MIEVRSSLLWSLTILTLIFLAACSSQKGNDEVAAAGSGRLVRWSQQSIESDKKIIFVHGFYTGVEDPQGLNPSQMRAEFSPKIDNLDSLGTELFGARTSELAEFWFYGYQPSQNIDKVASDLNELITNNSNFDDSQIAVIGYSQGGVVAWLLDQRFGCIDGGVILGAPILSTPLAHKDIRDQAIRRVFPVLGSALISVFDDLSTGTGQLAIDYPETGAPVSNLFFMVGQIDAPSADALTRNSNLVDVLAENYDNYLGNSSNDRQLMEVGATLIDCSDWRNSENCLSDGVVPVSSGWLGDPSKCLVWSDYDHSDLLSGKGDLDLDRATLTHLGKVLGLFPEFIEVPGLPILPELDLTQSPQSVWGWVKFAYTQNGHLYLTDEDWAREVLVVNYDSNYYPRFYGENLTWTTEIDSQLYVYLWQHNGVVQVGSAGSAYANFSHDGEELVYQSSHDLVAYNLGDSEVRTIVQGVNLIGPAVCQAGSFLSDDKLYFVSEANEVDNLYSIDFNSAEAYFSDAEVEARNCSLPFVAASPINGLVVISGGGSSQTLTIVSGGVFASHIQLTISAGSNNDYSIGGTTNDIHFYTPEELSISQAVFDPEYGHLYLVVDNDLWLLDINRIILQQYESADEIFYEVKQGVTSLDIKLTDG